MNIFLAILSAIVDGIMMGGIYAALAVGLALIFGILEILHIAQADFMILGAFTGFLLCGLGLDPLITVPISFLIVFIIAGLAFRISIKPVMDAPLLNQIVLTFGMALVLEGLMMAAFGGKWRQLSAWYVGKGLALGPIHISLSRLFAFLVAMCLFFLLFYLLKTTLGKKIQATGQNRTAASLIGINVEKIHMLTFCLGVGLAGAAGPLIGMVFPFSPYSGMGYLLIGFIVIVLGGMGSVPGAIIGGLTIGVIQSLATIFVSASMAEAVLYMVFVIILSVRPSGIFGVRIEK